MKPLPPSEPTSKPPLNEDSLGGIPAVSLRPVFRLGVAMLLLSLVFPLVSHSADTATSYKDPFTGMEFVFVKGGCYQMGDTFGDGIPEEKPVHEVCVSDFYMGKYPVTQAQYKKVMGNNPSHFKGENKPVEIVSWDDAVRFAAELGNKGEKEYRLPTEAEWEYAARSGGRQERYPGTSDMNELNRYAWSINNARGTTHPVGEKKPNGLGLYDMSGNVGEWCRDWYGKDYYANSPRMNPKGPEGGEYRVLRGGSWTNLPEHIRASYRFWDTPSEGDANQGFRLVFPSQGGK